MDLSFYVQCTCKCSFKGLIGTIINEWDLALARSLKYLSLNDHNFSSVSHESLKEGLSKSLFWACF